MKLVVVLLALLLLVWLVLGSTRRRRKGVRRDDDTGAKPPPAVEGMVACAYCGVHVPGSQALTLRDQSFCSAAHRDAGPRAP